MRFLKLKQWLLTVGCRISSDTNLQTSLIITDQPYPTPQPYTSVSSSYGILYDRNVFVQSFLCIMSTCNLQNASEAETNDGD